MYSRTFKWNSQEDMLAVTIGVVFPHHPTDEHRKPAKDLKDQAHWVRHHINDTELAQAQFPNRVPTLKKPVDKPAHW